MMTHAYTLMDNEIDKYQVLQTEAAPSRVMRFVSLTGRNHHIRHASRVNVRREDPPEN